MWKGFVYVGLFEPSYLKRVDRLDGQIKDCDLRAALMSKYHLHIVKYSSKLGHRFHLYTEILCMHLKRRIWGQLVLQQLVLQQKILLER